jgi:hypothetical protein
MNSTLQALGVLRPPQDGTNGCVSPSRRLGQPRLRPLRLSPRAELLVLRFSGRALPSLGRIAVSRGSMVRHAAGHRAESAPPARTTA